jgi:hypothetical protein
MRTRVCNLGVSHHLLSKGENSFLLLHGTLKCRVRALMANALADGN